MIILKLETKTCMSHLLLKETFDNFSFIEGEITTFNKFTFDGYIQKEFYEEAPSAEYSNWKELRDFCFSIIKGKRTPLSFKFIFSLSKENIAALIQERNLTFTPESVQGLYLNFRYDGTSLTCTTGTSMNTFTMDKTLEQEWDRWVQGFFAQKEIAFEAI